MLSIDQYTTTDRMLSPDFERFIGAKATAAQVLIVSDIKSS
jgi:hypothetical protein